MMNETEHLMLRLMEECAEVAQRGSKALIFGLSEVQEGQSLTNAERIEGELYDLLTLVEMLVDRGAIRPLTNREYIEAKKARVLKWLSYSESCGTLDRNLLAKDAVGGTTPVAAQLVIGGHAVPVYVDQVEVCLGCGQSRDCGCPAGTGYSIKGIRLRR